MLPLYNIIHQNFLLIFIHLKYILLIDLKISCIYLLINELLIQFLKNLNIYFLNFMFQFLNINNTLYLLKFIHLNNFLNIQFLKIIFLNTLFNINNFLLCSNFFLFNFHKFLKMHSLLVIFIFPSFLKIKLKFICLYYDIIFLFIYKIKDLPFNVLYNLRINHYFSLLNCKYLS